MIFSAIKKMVLSDAKSDTVTEAMKSGPSENEIRELAYRLWEESGRPEGDGTEFWLRAEAQMASQV